MIKNNFIFMADVINSSKNDQIYVAKQLKELINNINIKFRESISSPMTITLGDEYQGICKTVNGAVEIILFTESWILKTKTNFDLRYIVYEGKIDTPINTETSYGMLGSGLTEARKELTNKSKSKEDINFIIKDIQQGTLLNYLFKVILGIRKLPARKKHPEILNQFIYDALKNREIVQNTGKNLSEIWKYRKNWKIDIWLPVVNILKKGLYN